MGHARPGWGIGGCGSPPNFFVGGLHALRDHAAFVDHAVFVTGTWISVM
jgi:hypothetical protein